MMPSAAQLAPRTYQPPPNGAPRPRQGQVWRNFDAPKDRHILIVQVIAGIAAEVVRCTPEGEPMPGYPFMLVKLLRFTARATRGPRRFVYVRLASAKTQRAAGLA